MIQKSGGEMKLTHDFFLMTKCCVKGYNPKIIKVNHVFSVEIQIKDKLRLEGLISAAFVSIVGSLMCSTGKGGHSRI